MEFIIFAARNTEQKFPNFDFTIDSIVKFIIIPEPSNKIKIMVVKEYESPLGVLYLASIGNELCLCSWQGLAACHSFLREHKAESDYEQEWNVVNRARTELDEYFEGARESFDIPLRMFGTEFQKLVWEALIGIPYGVTESYGEVARSIGRPQAVRAVANACARNPLAIFIPCHRVTASDGQPGGYAGGKDVKQRLLYLEHLEHLEQP